MLQVLTIISEKQREVNLSLAHVYSSLLGKALQQDGGALLDLLLQRIHWEPGSVTFDGLNLVHPGAINEVAAHLPKLLEVGLPPDCRVGRSSGRCVVEELVCTDTCVSLCLVVALVSCGCTCVA